MKMTQTAITTNDIANVQLSNREQHGEYVVYTALSRDGVTKYNVTLHNGKYTGCSCPATVKCIHAKACEFEEAWSAPIAKYAHAYVAVCQCDACRAEKSRRDAAEAPEKARKAALKAEAEAQKRAAFEQVCVKVAAIEKTWCADDEQAHIEDSIRSGEFTDPFVGMSEQKRREAYRNMYPNDFYDVA